MDQVQRKATIESINGHEYEELLRTIQLLGGDGHKCRELKFEYAQLHEIRKGLESKVDVNLYLDPSLPWFVMEEIRLAIEKEIDLSPYLNKQFDWMQLSEIRQGIEEGLEVGIYADANYFAQQMKEIRLGLLHHVPVTFYLDKEYDWFQMEEIRKGLEKKVNVGIYADKKYDYLYMREIRKGLESGISLMEYIEKGYSSSTIREIRKFLLDGLQPESYIEQGYNGDQLEQIRYAYEKKIDISPYLSVSMYGVQLQEIMKGIESGVEVFLYGSSEYNWLQMREIRLGMEHRVDVTLYLNPLFLWKQMREIRYGLEEGIDVSGYAKLICSPTDMHRAREKMLGEELELADFLKTIEAIKVEVGPLIVISADGMEASVMLEEKEETPEQTEQTILELLKKQGVVLGIDKDAIHQMIINKTYKTPVVVARGVMQQEGEEGYYTFFFRTQIPTQPKLKEDGSVDYSNMDYFEEVKEGQKLAEYTQATVGKGGYTVTGKIMAAKKGKELPVLKGNGFQVLEDKITYIATISGKIELREYRITISQLFEVQGDVNYVVGNLRFDGDITINGSVRSGVTIEATGNIVISGSVESATIISGKDVLVRQGVQAGGNGMIQAKGMIRGKFFETVLLRAEGKIEANYMMNCDTVTKESLVITGKRGIIVGGITRAAYGITVHTLGNTAELPTVLDVGVTESYYRMYNEVEKSISKLNAEIRIFEEGKIKLEKVFPQEQLEEMSLFQKITMACGVKLQELEKQNEAKEELLAEINKMTQAQVCVESTAYPGSYIIINRNPLKLKEELQGVTFKQRDGRVVIFKNQ